MYARAGVAPKTNSNLMPPLLTKDNPCLIRESRALQRLLCCKVPRQRRPPSHAREREATVRKWRSSLSATFNDDSITPHACGGRLLHCVLRPWSWSVQVSAHGRHLFQMMSLSPIGANSLLGIILQLMGLPKVVDDPRHLHILPNLSTDSSHTEMGGYTLGNDRHAEL
ncbi:uncharacterized protein LY79DRAFT_81759 [Colletotrichum navitas]|uniref:Uncharacterized protein n=1 Tax=Colletotrichum navitas TaxID=681940 RepID=A0AAD8Q5C2_9PEZI|nr:uncharacterized protein LY79DRAFT_81759 [Colletotrichum navitas]KAK1596153.1 hypothetical protein LY79DRAFT_81759 [Colletotrichum navitas]